MRDLPSGQAVPRRWLAFAILCCANLAAFSMTASQALLPIVMAMDGVPESVTGAALSASVVPVFLVGLLCGRIIARIGARDLALTALVPLGVLLRRVEAVGRPFDDIGQNDPDRVGIDGGQNVPQRLAAARTAINRQKDGFLHSVFSRNLVPVRGAHRPARRIAASGVGDVRQGAGTGCKRQTETERGGRAADSAAQDVRKVSEPRKAAEHGTGTCPPSWRHSRPEPRRDRTRHRHPSKNGGVGTAIHKQESGWRTSGPGRDPASRNHWTGGAEDGTRCASDAAVV